MIKVKGFRPRTTFQSSVITLVAADLELRIVFMLSYVLDTSHPISVTVYVTRTIFALSSPLLDTNTDCSQVQTVGVNPFSGTGLTGHGALEQPNQSTHDMKLTKSFLTLIAVGVLSTVVAVAQPAQGGGGRGGFGLDEQQRTLFREALQKDSDKIRALDEKLRVAQKELVDAVLAATYDEKVVKEKAEAVAKIQVEMTMLRSKALATVAPTLKPEQKQEIAQSRFAIMMLSGGFGGGGGDQAGFGGQRGQRGGGAGGERAPGGDRGNRGGR